MKISNNQQILIDFLYKKANERTLANFTDICGLYDTAQIAASVLGIASSNGLMVTKDMGTDYKDNCYFLTDKGRNYVKYDGEIDFTVWEE